MLKRYRKTISFILAAAMILSLLVPVSAGEREASPEQDTGAEILGVKDAVEEEDWHPFDISEWETFTESGGAKILL